MIQVDELQPRNVYTYHGLTRVEVRLNNVSGAVLVVLSTLGGVGLPTLLLLTGDQSDLLGSLACASLGGLWMGGVGWMVGFGLLNAYPTVTIEDEGLIISAFIFSRIKIPCFIIGRGIERKEELLGEIRRRMGSASQLS